MICRITPYNRCAFVVFFIDEHGSWTSYYVSKVYWTVSNDNTLYYLVNKLLFPNASSYPDQYVRELDFECDSLLFEAFQLSHRLLKLLRVYELLFSCIPDIKYLLLYSPPRLNQELRSLIMILELLLEV